MEGTHNLYDGETKIGLSPEELELFRETGEVSAVHPGLGKQVDIFRYSAMPPSGQEDKPVYANSARFDPNGNLSIALPMSHNQGLELPLTISFVEIKPSEYKDFYFGKSKKAGGIVLAAAAPTASAQAKRLSSKKTAKTRTS